MEKFEEIFNSNFFDTISRIDTESDWFLVGWRGTMLNDGILWITDDYKIRAINYSSELGRQNRNRLIQLQAEELPSEQKDFDEPILNWYTEDFQIRVDRISGEYRLKIRTQYS